MKFNRNYSIISMRSKAELSAYAQEIIWKEGSAKTLGVKKNQLGAFIRAVGRHYRKNPYHNFQHAVDTTNTMAWFLTLPAFEKNLPAGHKFLLLVSALVHDVEHPGHDNQWEIKTNSPWTKQYRGDSYLERHSIAVTLELLKNPARDIFFLFSSQQRQNVEALFEQMILATDFACHNGFLKELEQVLARGALNFSEEATRSLISRALLKAADIGNTAKPFQLARRWGLRIMKENWAQGQKEKSHNFPVGPQNDPGKSDYNLAQAGFIGNSVLKLFQLLAQVESQVGAMVAELEKNQACYETQAKRSLRLVK